MNLKPIFNRFFVENTNFFKLQKKLKKNKKSQKWKKSITQIEFGLLTFCFFSATT